MDHSPRIEAEDEDDDDNDNDEEDDDDKPSKKDLENAVYVALVNPIKEQCYISKLCKRLSVLCIFIHVNTHAGQLHHTVTHVGGETKK